MLFRLIVLCALVGSPALSSAIKGYSAPEASKGGRLLAPVEQQRLVEQHQTKVSQRHEEQRSEPLEESVKGGHAEHREEQQAILQAAPLEQQQLVVKEEQVRLEDSKGRYEARPQVSHEELSKTAPAAKIEPKFEQQQLVQAVPFVEQVADVREEQRRFEDTLPLVQPVQPLTIIEETRSEQLPLGTKGGLVRNTLVAPIAETEPYAFSYQVDGSSRTESGDTKGVVRGQYTLQGADGSSRIVDYVADHNGFRASVNTNELGTEAKSPAAVALRSSQPNAEDITLRLEGKTKDELGYTAVAKGAPLIALPLKAPSLPLVQAADEGKTKLPAENRQCVPWPFCDYRATEESKTKLPVQKSEPLAAEDRDCYPYCTISGPYRETGESKTKHPAAKSEARSSLDDEDRKSAELRSVQQVVPVQTRAGTFESATAHRDHRRQQPVQYRRPQLVAPAVLVRAQPPPVLARPVVPAVSRAYLQRERYPPSPVQGYRRQYPVEANVVNPRVSFYGPASGANSNAPIFDYDQPAGFEHADS